MALSEDQFAKKAKAGTLTVMEAIDFALERKTINKSAASKLRTLRNQWEAKGWDKDLTLADMRKEENHSRLLKEVNKQANYMDHWASLERNIFPTLSRYNLLNVTAEAGDTLYPRIIGSEGVDEAIYNLGSPQRIGVGQTREMQELLPQAEIEKLYAEALPEIRAKHGDTVADLALYHKATFQRPGQLVSDGSADTSAIKKSDVKITATHIEIKGITVGTGRSSKTRPAVSYPKGSAMADLVLRNLERSTSEFLFDTTADAYNKAFKEVLSPRLMAYADVLPLYDKLDPSKGPYITPGVVRHFMSKMVADELKYPDDVVEGLMGHKSVNSSTFRKHYAGNKAIEGVGAILNNLYVGETAQARGFGGTEVRGFDSPLTEEEQRELNAEQVARSKRNTAKYTSEALEKNKQNLDFLNSEDGKKLIQQQFDEAKRQIDEKIVLEKYEKEQRALILGETEGQPSPDIEYDDDKKSGFMKMLDWFDNLPGGTKQVISQAPLAGTLVGGALLSQDIQADYAKGEGVLGTPPQVSAGIRTAKFAAEEFTPPGALIGMAESQATATKERGTELLEKSVDMTEDELLRSFGQFGSEVRGY